MPNILITGSQGQLGKACAHEFASFNPLLTDHQTCDLTNSTQCKQILHQHQPDIIIHCAAYTNVKKAETEPANAYAVNTIGTYNLLQHLKPETLFIYISTDFVFDGNHSQPYVETDLIHPQTSYGKSKYAGELLVQDLAPNHLILRTAWVYGDGKNFVQTMLTLAQKQNTLPIVHDQIGSPTYTKDLSSWIHQLIDHQARGLFHCVNDNHCSWADFAREIFHLKQISVEVENITTAQYAEKFNDHTPRPLYSALDNTKLKNTVKTIRPWKEALTEYLT